MSKVRVIVYVLFLLSVGCTAATNPDGSTTVRLAIPGLSRNADDNNVHRQKGSVVQNSVISGKQISQTNLAGIFAKHPWDGSTSVYYPKVAITVKDWSRSDCWLADAVIWLSAQNSEPVQDFNICMNKSLGAAINGAAGIHMFMEQSQISNHTGNIRTIGPKPPQFAISMTKPTPEGFADFVQQLVTETNWQPGPAEVTMWIVDFKNDKT